MTSPQLKIIASTAFNKLYGPGIFESLAATPNAYQVLMTWLVGDESKAPCTAEKVQRLSLVKASDGQPQSEQKIEPKAPEAPEEPSSIPQRITAAPEEQKYIAPARDESMS